MPLKRRQRPDYVPTKENGDQVHTQHDVAATDQPPLWTLPPRALPAAALFEPALAPRTAGFVSFRGA